MAQALTPPEVIVTQLMQAKHHVDARGLGQGHQGQLQLKRFTGKDFCQEFVAPAASAAFHGDAVLAGMLF
jgi:hypothetical protein